METVTKQLLKKIGACHAGTEYAIKNLLGMSYPDAIKQCIKDNQLSWANWGIVRVMDKINKVKYAVYAAKQVLKIYEDKYPNDARPREAIKAAERCIKNPIEENRKAALVAAYAADAAASAYAYAAAAAVAAYAAAYAAYAAADAADAAASAYAYAADAAASAYAYAADAAYAAYAAYAADAMKIKILKYGIMLLRKQDKE